jgi:hypothetical protein
MMAGITRLRPRIYRSPRPALVSVIALGALGAPGGSSLGGGGGGTPSWQPVRVGGGGFTRDMCIAPDGTKVCKIDVYGAYVYNLSVPNPGNAGGMGCWQQLCAPGRIPSGDPAYNHVLRGKFYTSGGAWDIRIAPSNSSVFYMIWLGMMYKSVNKGVTFVNQTTNAGGTFPQQNVTNTNANSPQNGWGPQIAIDPQNPNICFAGTLAGAYYTTNGGTTWNTISTSVLPLPTGNQNYGFAFDPVSAIVGGATQGIYASVNGVGVYYSSNGGPTWTLLSGGSFSGTMPTTHYRVIVDKFGLAWVADAGANKITVFTVHSGLNFPANTWTVTGASGGGAQVITVACDPASTSSATQRVISGGWNGSLCQSTNGGTTWTPNQGTMFNQVATDIPWLQTNELNMSQNGNMYFDPSVSNTLYFPEGIGVWYTNPPVEGGNATWPAWTWNSMTSGIESLETTHIISPPGGHVGIAQWDRNWFQITDPDVYPSTYGTWPGNRQNNNFSQSVIWPGMGVDYAPGTPSFIAINSGSLQSTAGQAVGSGFSTNGGVPITGWSFFSSMPTFSGGFGGQMPIVVSTPSIIMVCASARLWVTTDGGTSWSNVTPAGSSGWPNGFGQNTQQLASDRVISGRFIGYANRSIYVTNNSGASWTASTPGFSFHNGVEPKIRGIANNAGHFFICGGGSYAATPDTTNLFYRTINGGTTWSNVSNGSYTICDVYNFSYGAPNGGSYPTIFIYGTVNGVTGVWQSGDGCATWQMIGDAQFGGLTFDFINCMCGDMNVPGQVYVGLLGSGYLRYGI